MNTPIDLIGNVMEKKPTEAAGNFADMVIDRCQELVAAKRVEVASTMFGGEPIKVDEPEINPEVTEPTDETPEKTDADTKETA